MYTYHIFVVEQNCFEHVADRLQQEQPRSGGRHIQVCQSSYAPVQNMRSDKKVLIQVPGLGCYIAHGMLEH